jgi:legumain
MYGKLVFYLEACESGSMFQQLPTNMNIYALSASSPFESSWGYYCAPDDKVNGKSVGSCLGDLFSIAWMEDTDISDVSKKSLDEHFQIIKKRTTKSKVMQWGDVTFTKEPIGNYMGGLAKKSRFSKRLESAFKSAVVDGKHAIDTRDAKLFYLINHFKSNATNENL